MADDRMAIVCKKCRLGIAIAKRYYGGRWRQYPLNKERVNKFFEKHRGCGEQGYGARQYLLGYEDNGNWEYDMVGLDNRKE